MTEFIELRYWQAGVDFHIILNIDDIARIHPGPNTVDLKTPFADGSRSITVAEEDLERMIQILKVK